MNNELSNKQVLSIGLMLFALFLGAGNIIFPPFLGQQAGTNIWIAVAGFLVTGVGLPLLSVIAIGRAGNLQNLASRVHPAFGIAFTIIIYLAIGPLFGIPRTATVTYEVGVLPFLSESASQSTLSLFILTVVFFSLSVWLSLNPSKMVHRIGTIITPVLLVILSILAIKSIITPIGSISSPAEDYVTNSFFNGFIEGYLTMDTIGGLAFGIVIIAALKDLGVTNKKTITNVVGKAGLIAAIGLALVYLALTYIGATSVNEIGFLDNGAAVITASTKVLFGHLGSIILAIAITLACLTTSVGLITSCAHFFSAQVPALSYKMIVYVLAIFSTVIANVGLSTLISFSLPILSFIYPLAIMLILLSFLHKYFKGFSAVYMGGMIATGIISLCDALISAGINLGAIGNFVSSLPLSSQGIGWLIPGIIGCLIGYGIAIIFGMEHNTESNVIPD
ncbi:branched-chain amino acid transport system II carrier protein [Bacillus sp. AGMB 02131]|uniref:Branched-chain amino acid transport system carrier protein n=1 Tax=Peribacillus faecalis TaxID=2772559 RepID=A0A927D0J3_9BACI|nr:branched-chain amino acid transport system II carrier protein [Peribacillus faecalis]MBD3110479.1 branched-chain amino acid transport system II carrier protein [Peribacillus faecalis]